MRRNTLIPYLTKLFFVFSIFLIGCDGGTTDPEAQIRKLLSDAKEAVEEKDRKFLIGLLSDNYQDSQERNKEATDKLLRLIFLRNKSINLFMRVKDMNFISATHAKATIVVAMSSQPITADDNALLDVKADLHHFDVDLHKETEKDWKVLHVNLNNYPVLY